jgi:hypothetical protein
MTIDEYMSILRAAGYTMYKQGEGYLMLQGSDGIIVGIPDPKQMSEAQREEELRKFLATYSLE